MITCQVIIIIFKYHLLFTVVADILNSSAVFLVRLVCFSDALVCLRGRFFTGDRLFFAVEGPDWGSIFVRIPYKMSKQHTIIYKRTMETKNIRET